MTLTSVLWDLLLGLFGAGLAYGVYQWTENGLWTVGCIAAYSVVFIWFRARGSE